MKKIVFVIEELSTGGAERVTAALANSFASSFGYDVSVIARSESKNDYVLNQSVKKYIMPRSKYGRAGTIIYKYSWIRRTINSIGADYVISLAIPKTVIMLTFFSALKKYKLILSERNDPALFPKGALIRKLRNWTYLSCDKVVFQTYDAQEFFSEKIQKKSCVIPNPISDNLPERFQGQRSKRIVNFCRFEPQKNLEMLIKAFHKISNEFYDFELHLYGSGSEETKLKKLTTDLNLENKIVFHDFSTRVHEEINDCSLYVSTSNYEGISNSMLEALAMGVPTICTDCPAGGARMMIKNGKNGLLIPVGDVDYLAKAMKRVLSDQQFSNMISENAYKIRNSLNVLSISQQWLENMGENAYEQD